MTSFAEIGINDNIIKGINLLGFTTPTPVQEKVIPCLLKKMVDLVILAQTGTGKTAAFAVPLIQLTDVQLNRTQALVLCPTRELCIQVAKDMTAFGRYVRGLNILPVYGGTSIALQVKALSKGAQIIIATPGRLHDLLRRRKVDIAGVDSVVLDEADEMLQMGFQDELNAILAHTPDDKNTLLFSATMSKAVRKIAGNYMKEPMEFTIGQRNAGTENVDHKYYMIKAKDRYPALKRIVDINPDIYSIIFCRTRQETKDIAAKLVQDGYNADVLHGELSQGQRELVMKKFRCKKLQLLVATDVAARGLDVNDLSHVINYNLPDDLASYTHRSGRTGRAGKKGVSIAIIHKREKHNIRQIEKTLKRKFVQSRIPSGTEICQKQLLSLVDTVKDVKLDHNQIDPFFATIAKTLESLDREELIKRFVAVEFNSLLEYYRNAPDLTMSEAAKGNNFKYNRQKNQPKGFKFTRFFLNVGKQDGIHPQRLIGEINDVPGLPRIKIGKIEIMKNSAMFEADSRFATQVISAFNHLIINGKAVSVAIAGKARLKQPGRGGRKGSRTPKPTKKGYNPSMRAATTVQGCGACDSLR